MNHTDEAHFRAYFSPPLRLEALFTELSEISGRPSLAQTARLLGAYRDEYLYLAWIPVGVQRALGAIVRSLSRG